MIYVNNDLETKIEDIRIEEKGEKERVLIII